MQALILYLCNRSMSIHCPTGPWTRSEWPSSMPVNKSPSTALTRPWALDSSADRICLAMCSNRVAPCKSAYGRSRGQAPLAAAWVHMRCVSRQRIEKPEFACVSREVVTRSIPRYLMAMACACLLNSQCLTCYVAHRQLHQYKDFPICSTHILIIHICSIHGITD